MLPQTEAQPQQLPFLIQFFNASPERFMNPKCVTAHRAVRCIGIEHWALGIGHWLLGLDCIFSWQAQLGIARMRPTTFFLVHFMRIGHIPICPSHSTMQPILMLNVFNQHFDYAPFILMRSYALPNQMRYIYQRVCGCRKTYGVKD